MKIYFIFFGLLFSISISYAKGEFRLVDSIIASYINIDCADSSNCMAAGTRHGRWPLIRRTSDGGLTWNTVFIDSSTVPVVNANGDTVQMWKWDLNSVLGFDYPNKKMAVMTLKKAYIKKSTDAGLTWSDFKIDSADYDLNRISMFNENFGAIISSDYIYVTKNGWVDWNRVKLADSVPNSFLKDVFVLNESTIFVYFGFRVMQDSLGFILKSTDKGNTWNKLCDINRITNIQFLSDDFGIGYGIYCFEKEHSINRFNIKKTTDGGSTWKTLIDTNNPSYGPYDLEFVDFQNGVACLNYYYLLKLSDGGETINYDTIPRKNVAGYSISKVKQIQNVTYVMSLFDMVFRYFPDAPDAINDNRSITQNTESVYPNPAYCGSVIHLPLINTGYIGDTIDLSIYNSLGTKVAGSTYNNLSVSNSIAYELPASLSQGVYYYTLQSGNYELSSGSFVIVK